MSIEAHHHLRGVTFAKDASQLRTGTAPTGHGQPAQPLAIGILRARGLIAPNGPSSPAVKAILGRYLAAR